MPYLRKFGVLASGATCFEIPMVKRGVVDFAVAADWPSPTAGDVKVALDGGSPTNIANLPVGIASGNGGFWRFVLSSGELACKQCSVVIVDAATKAVEDNMFNVETYGNPAAMYPIDYSDSIRLGLTALPQAAAATSGGLPTVDSTNSVFVRGLVKKNVAFPNFTFLMTDSTTHAPKTGLAAGITLTRKIDSGSFAGATNTPSEVANGVYTVDLSAADLNGRVIMLRFVAAASDDRFIQIITVD